MQNLFVLGSAMAALALGPSPRPQAPTGALAISGTSTMGDWKCREAIGPMPAAPLSVGGTNQFVEAGLTLTFPVAGVDCGDATMNGKLRDALGAKRYPAIAFVLPPAEVARALAAGSAPLRLNGFLTIAGQTRPAQPEVTVTGSPELGVHVQGEQSLKMTDFGVRPPSLFFGTLRVRDLVHVVFDVVLRVSSRPRLGLQRAR